MDRLSENLNDLSLYGNSNGADVEIPTKQTNGNDSDSEELERTADGEEDHKDKLTSPVNQISLASKDLYQAVVSYYENGEFDNAEDFLIAFLESEAKDSFLVSIARHLLSKVREARDWFLDGLALRQAGRLDEGRRKFEELHKAMTTQNGKQWANLWSLGVRELDRKKESTEKRLESYRIGSKARKDEKKKKTREKNRKTKIKSREIKRRIAKTHTIERTVRIVNKKLSRKDRHRAKERKTAAWRGARKAHRRETRWTEVWESNISRTVQWYNDEDNRPFVTRSRRAIGPSYVVDFFIAGGGTGQVVQVHRQDSEEIYACKMIKVPENEVLVKNEIRSLHRGAHKHVVEIKEEFLGSDGYHIIVLKPRALYDLRSYMRLGEELNVERSLGKMEAGGVWTANGQRRLRCFRWIHCLASALEFLHKRGIRHRDIKPANILIDKSETVLYADFAYTFSDGGGTASNDTAPRGHKYYAPPEMLSGMKGDVFSFGCVVFEMLVELSTVSCDPLAKLARTAFPTVHHEGFASSICSREFLEEAGSYEEHQDILQDLPPEFQFKGLIKNMLGILFDRMVVAEGKRHCASCVTELFRQVMRKHGVDLNCCS